MQDSPDNSLFSFQLGTISAEDEATSSVESAPPSEETKAKLQEILQLLNQDIGQLVRDAEPIPTILKSLKGTLPEPLEEALHVEMIELDIWFTQFGVRTQKLCKLQVPNSCCAEAAGRPARHLCQTQPPLPQDH